MSKFFKVSLEATANSQPSLRVHGKSAKKDKYGKSFYEVKQYVGTKDPKVTSRIDIVRIFGVTKVFHRLFREGVGLVHFHRKK